MADSTKSTSEPAAAALRARIQRALADKSRLARLFVLGDAVARPPRGRAPR